MRLARRAAHAEGHRLPRLRSGLDAAGENITETYLHQIHQILDIARRYGTTDAKDPLVAFFERATEEEWMEIERRPPAHVTDLVGQPG